MKQITRCFECGKRIEKQYNNLGVQNLPWHDYWGIKKYGTHEGCEGKGKTVSVSNIPRNKGYLFCPRLSKKINV